MIQVSKQDLEKAFLYWYAKSHHKFADRELTPFLNSEIKSFTGTDSCDDENDGQNSTDRFFQKSWLEKARTSLFLSMDEVAKNMKINQSS